MKFSPIESIQFGWATFKKRPWFFIGATIVIAFAYLAATAVAAAVGAIFGGTPEEPSLAGSLAGNVVSTLLGTLVAMGVTAFYLAAHDSPETVELSALWHPRPYWKFLVTSLLFGIIVGIGMVLLIVPGVIAIVFLMFATFLVIDRELGPIDALKESVRITEGSRWPLLGFVVLYAVLVFAGLLAFGVGLLVAFPVVTLAWAYAYRLLSGGAVAVAPPDARLET